MRLNLGLGYSNRGAGGTPSFLAQQPGYYYDYDLTNPAKQTYYSGTKISSVSPVFGTSDLTSFADIIAPDYVTTPAAGAELSDSAFGSTLTLNPMVVTPDFTEYFVVFIPSDVVSNYLATSIFAGSYLRLVNNTTDFDLVLDNTDGFELELGAALSFGVHVVAVAYEDGEPAVAYLNSGANSFAYTPRPNYDSVEALGLGASAEERAQNAILQRITAYHAFHDGATVTAVLEYLVNLYQPPSGADALLLESGDYLLLENNDKILLED